MIKIFIGTSPNGDDRPTEAVLEYTLRKNSSEELDIEWMRQTNDKDNYWYGFQTQQWPTPFSGFRWVIPERCAQLGIGRAIYMDADQINFMDISRLYNTEMHGRPFLARRGKRFGGHEFCVMLIDVSRAMEQLIPVSRQRTMPHYHFRNIAQFSGNERLVGELDPRWNVLDDEGYKVEDMWHYHWTNMATQPWKPSWFKGTSLPHPRPDMVELFEKLKAEAAAAGYTGQEALGVEMDIIGQ